MSQIRRSDEVGWKAGMQHPRPNLETIPFFGKLRGEARVSARVDPEVRRRDVGQQRYGEGVPKFNSHSTDVFGNISKEKPRLEFKETSHGNVGVPIAQRKLGFMPSANAVDFLSTGYIGTRAPDPPLRYYK